MQSQVEGHDLSGAATTYTHSTKSKWLYHLIDLITVLAFWISIYKTRLCKKNWKKVLLNLIDFVFSKWDTTGCITSSSVHMLTYNKVYIKSCSKKVRLYIGTYVQLLIKKLHKAFVWLVRWQQLVKMTFWRSNWKTAETADLLGFSQKGINRVYRELSEKTENLPWAAVCWT